ncbi:hypothetical protein FKM82_021451 [Ascaphus truei]
MYNTFMIDNIHTFWKRNIGQNGSIQSTSGILKTKHFKKNIEGWVGTISGLFRSGMSVWNRADIEALYGNEEKCMNMLKNKILQSIVD